MVAESRVFLKIFGLGVRNCKELKNPRFVPRQEKNPGFVPYLPMEKSIVLTYTVPYLMPTITMYGTM